MSKILQKTEINLIKKSTICDKNTNLARVLEMFPNGINKKDLKTLKKDFIDVYDIIATAELREILINDSASEWKQGEHIGEKNIPCELCGNKFSKQKFTIINKFNSNSMLVGSACICKFANINKIIKGENLNTIKNSEVFDRLVKFNKVYEKGKNEITYFIEEYNKFDISFPIEFDTEFEKIIKDSKKYYNDFKKGKIPESKLKEFQIYKNDFDHLKRKCKKFVSENKNNKFICTKEIENELRDKKLYSTLKDIKSNNSLLKDWHIKYIENIKFIEQFIKEISCFFSKNYMDFLEINNKKIVVEGVKEYIEGLKFELSISQFMNHFSDVISKGNIYKSDDILFHLRILKEKNNIFNYIDILYNILKKHKYYTSIDDEIYDSGYFKIYNKNNKVARVNLNDLLDAKFLFVFKNKPENIDNYMKNLNWKDKSDENKFDIGNIGKLQTGGNFI
ncbi:hypothetical protein [Clostridium perfringens]|uniref:hypothetical protein n=1 Tax=Clostridium perfringens TaxID=1502 RepID=UPI0024BC6CB2|nr:hypothetical protein [Clostridium perfringens]